MGQTGPIRYRSRRLTSGRISYLICRMTALAAAAIDVRGVRQASGRSLRSGDVDSPSTARAAGHRGPERLREVHPPLRDRRIDPARRGDRHDRRRHHPEERLKRCALMPQRDLLLPWRNAIDNAAIALQNRGVKSARGTGADAAPVRAVRPRGVRGADARPALRGHASARRVPADPHGQKDVLLLDEPFAALDSITRSGMQDGCSPPSSRNRGPSCW